MFALNYICMAIESHLCTDLEQCEQEIRYAGASFVPDIILFQSIF